MTRPIGNESLELEVTDFGPIVEARIDLRPLTVFVGPSNTGKSWLATLIYALHRVFSYGASYPGMRFRRVVRPLWRQHDLDLSEASTRALLETVRSLTDDVETHDSDGIVLPPAVTDILRSGFNQLAHPMMNEICRYFGIDDADAMIRRGRTDQTRVVIRRQIGDSSDVVEQSASFGRKSDLRITLPDEIRIPFRESWREIGHVWRRELDRLNNENSEVSLRHFAAREVLPSLTDSTLPYLVEPLHSPAYYLPAGRTGILHAHRVVVGAMIASAPFTGLRTVAQAPVMSGVLADFLQQLIGIGNERTHPRRRMDLGKEIESDIIQGSVHVHPSAHTDYPNFTYRPHGWKNDLALANTSSMISELVPVVLYLRHFVEPNHVLIVEEPESHLHPAMQVKFTLQLAALVEKGVRVIVTTHSEWLLEELANIVRRSQLPESDRDNRIALKPDQVGAWLFQPRQRPRGSVVKEIGLDGNGLYPVGYEEVANALHNDWADISSRLETNS